MPVDCIQGYPDCPNCGHSLSLRDMPDVGQTYWHCTKCKEQWETSTLCIILEPTDMGEEISTLDDIYYEQFRLEQEASRWEQLARELGA